MRHRTMKHGYVGNLDANEYDFFLITKNLAYIKLSFQNKTNYTKQVKL